MSTHEKVCAICGGKLARPTRTFCSHACASKNLMRWEPCNVPDCEKKKRNNGYCDMHDQRMRATGSLELTNPWRGLSIEERFWKHVSKGRPDECWEWQGEISNTGYGVFGIYVDGKRKKMLAHRMALEFNGSPPGSLFALHSCDNPPCVNPAHLRLGTQTDNMQDALKRGRLNLDGLLIGQKLTAGARRRNRGLVA